MAQPWPKRRPQPLDPGEALLDQLTEAAAPPARTTRSQTLDLPVIHTSQTRFNCPACKLTYTTHDSYVRHIGVSHARLKFKCALCEYVNTNLHATANHYKLTHGAVVPPLDVVGSNEKACPFCPRTFPSARSCAQHIREQHMLEANEQRAREAAEREKQRGTSTARSKWGEGEISRFNLPHLAARTATLASPPPAPGAPPLGALPAALKATLQQATSPSCLQCGRQEQDRPIQGTPWGEHGGQPPPPSCQYEPLKQHLLQQHQHVNIHPFIVGSLGSWYPENDRVLSTLRIGHRYVALMRRLCVVSAIAGSQNIWYQAICKSHRRGPPTVPDPQPTAAIGGPAMAAPHPPEATPDAPQQ
ncbi:hypothetical protein EMCRGX_G005303 [Ephydatia muelleri]